MISLMQASKEMTTNLTRSRKVLLQMVTILDVMGEASAQAQSLKNPITR